MRRDRQDSWQNGIIVGISLPVLMFFVLTFLDRFIPRIVYFMRDGFSEQIIVMLAIFCNIIPFQVFLKQKRDYAMQGVILATFICIAYYMAKYKFHLI